MAKRTTTLLIVAMGAALAGVWGAARGHWAGWALLLVAAAAGWWAHREFSAESARNREALAEALKQAAVRDQELDQIRKVADAMVSGDTLDHVLRSSPTRWPTSSRARHPRSASWWRKGASYG